jgi:hypothetical protein
MDTIETEKGIYISKIDAARRQLEMAISMFFNYSDVVSIHTLSEASYEILNDICKKKRIKSYKEQILALVKPDKIKFFRKKLDESKNFFKHANFDSNKQLEFNPEITEFVIFDCYGLYLKLTRESTALMDTFKVWFVTKNYELFITEKENSTFILKGKIDPKERNRYLTEVFPYIIRKKSGSATQ